MIFDEINRVWQKSIDGSPFMLITFIRSTPDPVFNPQKCMNGNMQYMQTDSLVNFQNYTAIANVWSVT